MLQAPAPAVNERSGDRVGELCPRVFLFTFVLRFSATFTIFIVSNQASATEASATEASANEASANEKNPREGLEGGRIQKSRPKSHKKPASLMSRYAIAAKRSMMCGQLGRLPPLSEAAATARSRGPTGRASIRAADDVLEADLQSDEILACFEEALGERQPEMGTDAAAGREANAESAEAAPRLEAAAEQQREHSLLAPTAGRGVEPVLPDPVPMLHTNSGGGRRSCEPDAGAGQQIGSAQLRAFSRGAARLLKGA